MVRGVRSGLQSQHDNGLQGMQSTMLHAHILAWRLAPSAQGCRCGSVVRVLPTKEALCVRRDPLCMPDGKGHWGTRIIPIADAGCLCCKSGYVVPGHT